MDATNFTKSKRIQIRDTFKKYCPDAYLMWIELICNDQQIIQKNINNVNIQVHPDFLNMKKQEVMIT